MDHKKVEDSVNRISPALLQAYAKAAASLDEFTVEERILLISAVTSGVAVSLFKSISIWDDSTLSQEKRTALARHIKVTMGQTFAGICRVYNLGAPTSEFSDGATVDFMIDKNGDVVPVVPGTDTTQ